MLTWAYIYGGIILPALIVAGGLAWLLWKDKF